MFLAAICAYTLPHLISEEYPVAQGVAFGCVFVLYFLVFEGVFGRTPGKWATGLTVVDRNGERAGWQISLIRNLAPVVEVNPMLGAFPAILAIYVTPRGQRVGDLLAGAYVVETRLLRRTPRTQQGSDPETCASCGEPVASERAIVCPVCGRPRRTATR